MERKERKKQARQSLKKHYLIFVAACLLAAFIGAEFPTAMNFTRIPSLKAEVGGEKGFTGLSGGSRLTAEAVADALTGNTKEARNLVARRETELKKRSQKSGNQVLGRTNGVLAEVINAVSSGSIEVAVISAVTSIFGTGDGVVIALILGSLLLLLVLWALLINVFKVIIRRMFLEGRCYEQVSIQRFLFLLRVKKWGKASRTMLVKWAIYRLWCLTVIGGIIKRYSYYLVPYIVAENPDIGSCQALTLSRKMMDGHKWECFTWECSLVGWYLLNIVTLGLAGVFFVNPYRMAVFAEYYEMIRGEALGKELEGTELLNDTALFAQADRAILQDAYKDVLEMMRQPQKELTTYTGVAGWMESWLGIVPYYSQKEKNYEKEERKKLQIQASYAAVEGRVYPGRLFPIKEAGKRSLVESIHYMRHYSLESIVLLFFIFSFVGWVWEVSLHLVNDGQFVNRGVLHGPWLPIYGAGGVLVLVLLKKLRGNPLQEFAGIVLVCGTVEYMTSYVLEKVHHGTRWWDYSGYFLNLNGRICAEGLLVFGLGGIMFVYIFAPLIDNKLRQVRQQILFPLCILLVFAFAADGIYSLNHPNTGDGITNYPTKTSIRQPHDHIGENLYDSSLSVASVSGR